MKKPAPKKASGKKDEPKENYVSLPKDFEDPKVDEGETFECVATIRREKDGYCVTALDGVPMDAEKVKDGADEEDDGGESIGAGAKKMMEGNQPEGDY